MEYYKNRFKNKSLKLDEQSYEEYLNARKAYEKYHRSAVGGSGNLHLSP